MAERREQAGRRAYNSDPVGVESALSSRPKTMEFDGGGAPTGLPAGSPYATNSSCVISITARAGNLCLGKSLVRLASVRRAADRFRAEGGMS